MAEAAILSVQRAADGFQGPKDIFNNPSGMFLAFERSKNKQVFCLDLP